MEPSEPSGAPEASDVSATQKLHTLQSAACVIGPVQSMQVISAYALSMIAQSAMVNEADFVSFVSTIEALKNWYGPSYREVMEDEADTLDDFIAYEDRWASSRGNDVGSSLEMDGIFNPVMKGPAPRITEYTKQGSTLLGDLQNLNAFISRVKDSVAADSHDIKKILKILDVALRTSFPAAQIVSNVQLVKLDTNSLFPKFSFSILYNNNDSIIKAQLLSTSQNGMGDILNLFMCNQLRPYFESILPDFVHVKIISPTESNSLWQIKLSVFGNDFVFFSIQLIAVKDDYFGNDSIVEDLNIPDKIKKMEVEIEAIKEGLDEMKPAEEFAAKQQELQALYEKRYITLFSYNLCFSLYNKCLSKDFNCLCSLSELDVIMFKKIVTTDGYHEHFKDYFNLFLDKLPDTGMRSSRQKYFVLGLYNLMVSACQSKYTPETKAYEMLFDAAPGENVFLSAMEIIKYATERSIPNDPSVSTVPRVSTVPSVQFAMGGGKLYALFQKALNNFKADIDALSTTTITTSGGVLNPLTSSRQNQDLFYQINLLKIQLTQLKNGVKDEANTDYSYLIKILENQIEELQQLLSPEEEIFYLFQHVLSFNFYEVPNPAADADLGMFYGKTAQDAASGKTAQGAASCMALCMILQTALTQHISPLFAAAAAATPTPWTGSKIDVGNSCIGSPPVTLSSLRITTENSFPFYKDVIFPIEAGDDNPKFTILPSTILARLGLNELGVQSGGDINTVSLKSTISPFDFVQKGDLGEYIAHILEAMAKFGKVTEFTSKQINTLSNKCMITAEGCSTPLKGIFDIFYTLFIIENFSNRALVTQKINKELKRVAICAKVLFVHYVELYNHVTVAEPEEAPEGETAEAIAAIPTREELKKRILEMLYILADMISYGYNGYSLRDNGQLNIIMGKYVEFVNKIIDFASRDFTGYRSFLFYCSVKTKSTFLTNIEKKFKVLLTTSSAQPVVVASAAEGGGIGSSIIATQSGGEINGTVKAILDKIGPILGCMRNSSFGPIVDALNDNKEYCAKQDSDNKKTGVLIFSSAYQSVLMFGEATKFISPEDPPTQKISGIFDLFMDSGTSTNLVGFIGEVVGAIIFNKDRTLFDNMLCEALGLVIPPDIGDGFHVTDPNNLGLLIWFLESVFGIKTKSSPNKIKSLTNLFLNLIRQNKKVLLPVGTKEVENIKINIFGFNLTIPLVIVEATATVAPSKSGINFMAADDTYRLCLAYDDFTCRKAFNKYGNLAVSYGVTAVPLVQILTNTNMIALFTGEKASDDFIKTRILKELIKSFSKLPKGMTYERAIEILRTKVDSFLKGLSNISITSVSLQNVIEGLFEILNTVPVIPFVPLSHDVTKFIGLPYEKRVKWILYLVQKILTTCDPASMEYNHEIKSVFFYTCALILFGKYLLFNKPVEKLDISILKPGKNLCIAKAVEDDISFMNTFNEICDLPALPGIQMPVLKPLLEQDRKVSARTAAPPVTPRAAAPLAAVAPFSPVAVTPRATAASKRPPPDQDKGLFEEYNRPPKALERQDSVLSCGRHALNNLLRGPFFSFSVKDSEPVRLKDSEHVSLKSLMPKTLVVPPEGGPINLHKLCRIMVEEFREVFAGDPNYCRTDELHDITLLNAALNLRGCVSTGKHFTSGAEFDEFVRDSSRKKLKEELYLLVNLGGNHWVAVRKYGDSDTLYLYDSLESKVITFDSIEEFKREYLKQKIFIYGFLQFGGPRNPAADLEQINKNIELQKSEFILGQRLKLSDELSTVQYVERKSVVLFGKQMVTHFIVADKILQRTDSESTLDTFKCVEEVLLQNKEARSNMTLEQLFQGQAEAISCSRIDVDSKRPIKLFLFGTGSKISEVSNYVNIAGNLTPFILCVELLEVPTSKVLKLELKDTWVTLDNGGIYKGEWLNEKMNGIGTLRYERKPGDKHNPVYEGSLVDGLKQGKGTMNFGDGGKYEGNWNNDLMDGEGTYTYEDGIIYEGRREKGKKTFGQMIYPNGSICPVEGSIQQTDKCNPLLPPSPPASSAAALAAPAAPPANRFPDSDFNPDFRSINLPKPPEIKPFPSSELPTHMPISEFTDVPQLLTTRPSEGIYSQPSGFNSSGNAVKVNFNSPVNPEDTKKATSVLSTRSSSGIGKVKPSKPKAATDATAKPKSAADPKAASDAATDAAVVDVAGVEEPAAVVVPPRAPTAEDALPPPADTSAVLPPVPTKPPGKTAILPGITKPKAAKPIPKPIPTPKPNPKSAASAIAAVAPAAAPAVAPPAADVAPRRSSRKRPLEQPDVSLRNENLKKPKQGGGSLIHKKIKSPSSSNPKSHKHKKPTRKNVTFKRRRNNNKTRRSNRHSRTKK